MPHDSMRIFSEKVMFLEISTSSDRPVPLRRRERGRRAGDIYEHCDTCKTHKTIRRKRERRRAGDIYEHCDTCKTHKTIRRKRERRRAGDIYEHCDTCKTHKTIRKKREREELVIFISIATPARPIKPSEEREN